MKYKYTKLDKIKFYSTYLFHKLIIFRDVKNGTFNLYVAEVIWMISLLSKKKLTLPKKISRNYFETIFGKFFITPDLLSTIAVSPAFERTDLEYLIQRMKKEVKTKRKILFLDIGAYFGLYSVAIGNYFKNRKNLDIIAFEPDSEYLSAPTYDLLIKNIKLNHIKNIKVYKQGIGSKKHENKMGMKLDTLDSILGKNYLKKYDEVFIKLDIDDFVVDGLKGIFPALSVAPGVTLLVEDFVKRKETLTALSKSELTFLTKKSEYNSFWIKHT